MPTRGADCECGGLRNLAQMCRHVSFTLAGMPFSYPPQDPLPESVPTQSISLSLLCSFLQRLTQQFTEKWKPPRLLN